jgi:glycosyltransferase involved in cell wall biosynthesis
MKILVLIASMEAGGAQRVSAHLANAWAARSREITLATFARAERDFYDLDGRVRRCRLDLPGASRNVLDALGANLRRVLALRRVLREERPDVVVAMMTTAAVLAIMASFGLPCRVIACERSFPPSLPIGALWSRLRRVVYPHAHRVAMLTTEGLDWLEHAIPAARGIIIPNPVPFPLPETGGRSPLPIPAGRRLLLAVGRCDEGKQFAHVIAAFADLAAGHARWDLAIVGDGPLREALQQEATRLGLASRVSLPGAAPAIAAWYYRADLFVMTSRFEGFPNALAEAMAHGCPAISYDCHTGPRDIIRHGQDGLLVSPVGDVAALTRALDGLMGDDARRARMSHRALEVRERYAPERVLAMWDQIFEAKA